MLYCCIWILQPITDLSSHYNGGCQDSSGSLQSRHGIARPHHKASMQVLCFFCKNCKLHQFIYWYTMWAQSTTYLWTHLQIKIFPSNITKAAQGPQVGRIPEGCSSHSPSHMACEGIGLAITGLQTQWAIPAISRNWEHNIRLTREGRRRWHPRPYSAHMHFFFNYTGQLMSV
jgi:hypothetical protein